MLAYLDQTTHEPQAISVENQASLKDAVWIDLLFPTKEEECMVEQYINRYIPTREEMVEIEVSSRLYRDDGALFMTALMIAKSDSPVPQLEPVTFVLTQNQLITVRYIEPLSFKLFISQLKRHDATHRDAIALFIELLTTAIDRLADILENVGAHLDKYSKILFQAPDSKVDKLDYQEIMRQIGMIGDLDTKARESLATFNRLILFFGQNMASRLDVEKKNQLTILHQDINSLNDHANFLSTKINFLLDATLGMISIEQNNIIKIFSVAAVIFLPPTLIASIYGMNFQVMPELSWKYGYVYALGTLVLGALLPYKYFKYRKWL